MAPRALPPTTTIEQHEDETLYTRAGLKADEHARDLQEQTDGWLPLVDAQRLFDRTVRAAVAEAEAERSLANVGLDRAGTDFGDDLHRACARDRTSPRWTQFFRLPVSRFNRLPLQEQVTTVRGWLTGSQDPILAQHRATLEARVAAADAALVKTRSLATLRGENWIRREELAETLTRQRDSLYEQLSARAREHNLGRDWAASFFRLTPRRDDGGRGEGTGEE